MLGLLSHSVQKLWCQHSNGSHYREINYLTGKTNEWWISPFILFLYILSIAQNQICKGTIDDKTRPEKRLWTPCENWVLSLSGCIFVFEHTPTCITTFVRYITNILCFPATGLSLYLWPKSNRHEHYIKHYYYVWALPTCFPSAESIVTNPSNIQIHLTYINVQYEHIVLFHDIYCLVCIYSNHLIKTSFLGLGFVSCVLTSILK